MVRRSLFAATASLGAVAGAAGLVAACASSDGGVSGSHEDPLGAQAAAAPSTCYTVLRSDVAPAAMDASGLFWLSTDDPAHMNATFAIQSVGIEGGQGTPASSLRASDPDGEGAATVTLDRDDIYVTTAKHVWSLAKADQATKAPGILYDLDGFTDLGTSRDLAAGGVAVDDKRLYLSLLARQSDDPSAPGQRLLIALSKDKTATPDAGPTRPFVFDLGARGKTPDPAVGLARGSAPLFLDGDRIYLTLPAANVTLKSDGTDPQDFFAFTDGQSFRPAFLLSDDKFIYAHGVLTHDQPGDSIPAIVRQPKAGGPVEILLQEPKVFFLAMAIDDNAIYFLEQRIGVKPSKRLARIPKKGGDPTSLVEYDGPLGANADGALPGWHHMLAEGGFVYWDDDALTKVPTSGCAPASSSAPDAGATPDASAAAATTNPPPSARDEDDSPPPSPGADAPSPAASTTATPAAPKRDKACSFAPPRASGGQSTGLSAWVGLLVVGMFVRSRRRKRA
jgi:hypothetical protein